MIYSQAKEAVSEKSSSLQPIFKANSKTIKKATNQSKNEHSHSRGSKKIKVGQKS